MTFILARIVSFFSYPYLLIPPGSFLILLKETNNISSAAAGTFFVICFTLIIFLFELIGLRMGFFSNFDISKRNQRTTFYLFVLLMLGASVIAGLTLRVPAELSAAAVGLFVGVSLMFLVNRKIKASIHLATISGLLLTVTFLYGSYFYFALLLIPLIAWSRVKTKKHTVSETIAGVILGVIITAITYAMVQYIP